jgi:hypothetical protein
MVLQMRDAGLSKKPIPRITELVWNLVDKPWDFYSIRYVLDDYTEHLVYIPAKLIATELEHKTIVDIIVDRLRAELACEPVHIDRITKEMQRERKRSSVRNRIGIKKRKLA